MTKLPPSRIRQYPDVPHIKRFPIPIVTDEFVIIQAMEKGAIISFGLIDGEIAVNHMHRVLSETRDLDGVYSFLIKHLTPIKRKIHETMHYYGIWTANKRFLLMDMYNTVDGQFHSFFVKQFARQLKLQTIDVLYQGSVPDSEILKELTAQSAHGICVKPLNSFSSGGQLQYVLLKTSDLMGLIPETVELSEEHIWIQEHVTMTVVVRALHELMSDGLVPRLLTEDDLRDAMKHGLAQRIRAQFESEIEQLGLDGKLLNRALGKRVPRLLGEWFKEQK